MVNNTGGYTCFCPGVVSGISKRRLATTIAGVMATYRRYPESKEYERVARELFRKYPCLKDPLSGHVSFCQCKFTYKIE